MPNPNKLPPDLDARASELNTQPENVRSNKMVAQSFPRLSVRDVKKLLIRAINFSHAADKSRHDKMVALAERMLDLHKQKQVAKSDAARERLEREITLTDEQIDALAAS